MKTLVIHSQDPTTDFLSAIYSDKDWTIINSNVSKKLLKESIKSHDKIVMLGHGSENGLIGFDHFIIDSTFVYLLREKECVCIWCNADGFVNKYELKGFYTGMIVSDSIEANIYCISANDSEIKSSNLLFADSIKKSIDNSDMLSSVKGLYKSGVINEVIMFNKNNLYATI